MIATANPGQRVMTSALRLKIVVGRTREGRRADAVASWVLERAADHGAFDAQLVDLRSFRLPMLGEDDLGSGVVDAFNAVLADGDVHAFVTPEYNHSVPRVLKNAIDDLSWWGEALRRARSGGELPPAGTRRVAA